MPRPLAVITVIVERERALRKSIGRHAMTAACLTCALAECNTRSAGCEARNIERERSRRLRRKHAEKRRAETRAYHRAHRQERCDYARRYREEPGAAVALAVKRRMRYAAKKAAQGKTVRSYRWTNPQRNQAWRTRESADT